jgi:putative peptide zinc metalloprotease protein
MNSKLFHCPSHFELISGQTYFLNDKAQLVSYELSKELFELLTYCRFPRTKAELIDELSKKMISFDECQELILELDALTGKEQKIRSKLLRRVNYAGLCGIDLRINKCQFSWLNILKLFSVEVMIGLSLLAILSLLVVGIGLGKGTLDIPLPFWGLFLVLLSTPIHELGHAIAFKSLGGSAFSMGVGFYFFIPVLFVDVSLSNSLSRASQLKISAAGVYFELIWILFLLGCALSLQIDWMYTVILLIGIQALWNLNPFFRSDGYWILSDLANIRWLSLRSTEELRRFIKTKKPFNGLVFYAIVKRLFVAYCIFHLIYQFFFAEKRLVEVLIDFIRSPSIDHYSVTLILPFLLLISLFRYAAKRLQ